MEVKKEAVDVFHEQMIKIPRGDEFNISVTSIKQENIDFELENELRLLSTIKTEPEDVPDNINLTELETISSKIGNFKNDHVDNFCMTTSNFINVKQEVEGTALNPIKTELLNEECDLPTVKIEVIEQPCSSQSENLIQLGKTAPKIVNQKKKKYCCPICQKICVTSTSRKKHLDSHFGKRRCVTCIYCGDTFTSKLQFLIHNINYHVKVKSNLILTSKSMFTCKICLKEFTSKRILAEHFKVHYSKPYECKICFKQYSVKSTLKRHLAALHSMLKPFKCEICYKEFALACQHKSHMLNHKFGKQFKCDICMKGFYQKSSLMRHIIVHNGVKFKCNLCNKEYTRKVTLESHMRLHSGEHEFKCHICLVEKRFTSKGALRLHLMNHAGEKPHKCELCSQRFLERQKLLKHLKTHEKAKNFCEFCSVSFLYKVRLQRHLLTEHGENPFKCLKCSEKFATQRELNLHASIHVEFKMYECEICLKQFTKRAAYVRHLGGHGQSPFSCGVCSQAFSSERGLREHYVVHPGEKPFHCDVCFKGFHHKRSLHKHICEGAPVVGT